MLPIDFGCETSSSDSLFIMAGGDLGTAQQILQLKYQRGRYEKNINPGQLGIGSIDYFRFSMLLREFSPGEGISAHCIV